MNPNVTKALILAAGAGERQRVNGDCKPLVSLLGLTLIERVILTTMRSGIGQFHVVIGYNGEKIRERLADGSSYGATIDYIYNDEWERGNGLSVLKARNAISEPFMLVMADHIFDENIVTRLQGIRLGKDECVLCVDENARKFLDQEDATKLLIEGGRIVDIGKRLKRYNGFDTGIFLCTPVIFDALQKSIESGNDTLSGGVKILANEGKVRALDVTDDCWIDVDDDRALKNAESLLIDQLNKKTDGPVSRVVNRRFSIPISKQLVKLKVTPGQISLFSFGLAVISAALFSLGKYPALLAGGALAQIASIIDGCDGEVARLKLTASRYGGWFDAVLDRYAEALIVLGMAWGHWILNGDVSIWVAGFLALVGSFLNSYTADKYDGYLIARIASAGGQLRMGRDVRLFLIFLGALVNQVFATLVVLAIITNLESVRRMFLLKSADA